VRNEGEYGALFSQQGGEVGVLGSVEMGQPQFQGSSKTLGRPKRGEKEKEKKLGFFLILNQGL
jgi:hypothetical protein